MGRTVHLGDNRVQQVNLMDIPVGVTVHAKTENSNWYFCRVEGSRLNAHDLVSGVMVVTDSKAWGQVHHGPFQTGVSSMIEIGKPIWIKTDTANSCTGDVRSIVQERR